MIDPRRTLDIHEILAARPVRSGRHPSSVPDLRAARGGEAPAAAKHCLRRGPAASENTRPAPQCRKALHRSAVFRGKTIAGRRLGKGARTAKVAPGAVITS
jgi:hypothetical protein